MLALPPKTMIWYSEFAGGWIWSGTPLTETTIFWPPDESACWEITMLSVP